MFAESSGKVKLAAEAALLGDFLDGMSSVPQEFRSRFDPQSAEIFERSFSEMDLKEFLQFLAWTVGVVNQGLHGQFGIDAGPHVMECE